MSEITNKQHYQQENERLNELVQVFRDMIKERDEKLEIAREDLEVIRTNHKRVYNESYADVLVGINRLIAKISGMGE